jgi:TolA-binding protein
VTEADVYSHAHRLHFDGADPAAALAAWDDYMARYPNGRFAPEARYNRGIDLLKMKRYADARAALQPFADGAFGDYHRHDARELLKAIP